MHHTFNLFELAEETTLILHASDILDILGVVSRPNYSITDHALFMNLHPIAAIALARDISHLVYIGDNNGLADALLDIQLSQFEHLRWQDAPPKKQAVKEASAELVVIDLINSTASQKDTTETIAWLRNIGHDALLILENADIARPLHEYLALGFAKSQSFKYDGLAIQSYLYELSHYNFKRAWNNARFWANPENFRQYRW